MVQNSRSKENILIYYKQQVYETATLPDPHFGHFTISLPAGDANITFTVTVFKSSEPNKNVTQSITVTTVYSDLIAIIRGGNQLTIGRDSGYVAIDGSSSFDPDDEALDMTYSWQCEQVRA